MRRLPLITSLIVVMVALALLTALVFAQDDTGITAEAVGQANVRSIPSVDGEIVAEIISGTRYAALGRNEFVNWVLIGEQTTLTPIGWVFGDLLTLQGGTIGQLPLLNVEIGVDPTPLPVPSNTLPPLNNTTGGGPTAVVVTPPAGNGGTTTSPTQAPQFSTGVTGLVQGEINVRYGPGVEYPTLVRAFAGEVFEINATHSDFPWVRVTYAESPTGFAWIASDLLEISGNLAALPIITQTVFNLPELTPTPARREAVAVPGQAVVAVSDAFAALGDGIWNSFLAANFVPEGSRFASLYIQDLQTGEALSYNSDVAYSGTSVNKIAVLVEYFAVQDTFPTAQDGVDITKTMICSQNVTTNELLGIIGGNGIPSEDYLGGAEMVTILLRRLGFQNTFLTAPYDARPNFEVQPTAPPRAVEIPETDADQTRANPNPANQVTVDELGALLSAIYECAYRERGPLLTEFDGAFTPQECRVMLHVMENNTVDAFIAAGVPENIRVAHKHGWIADTHTNAGIVFTPGGDYVMVAALYQPETILFGETLPLVANASRAVYNYYNPDALLDEPREGFIPATDDCAYNPNHPLVLEIIEPGFLRENDTSLFYQGAVPPLPALATPEATPDVALPALATITPTPTTTP